jgi:hypothetical protein
MTILYVGAPAAIAVSLSVLVAGAWALQPRTRFGWLACPVGALRPQVVPLPLQKGVVT